MRRDWHGEHYLFHQRTCVESCEEEEEKLVPDGVFIYLLDANAHSLAEPPSLTSSHRGQETSFTFAHVPGHVEQCTPTCCKRNKR